MTLGGRAGRVKPTLRIGSRRYPILSHDAASCLIRAPVGARLRGVADIFEGERHVARCLVLLSESEGDLIRLSYTWRTPVQLAPPLDFAL
jgi:hypothetical protein